MQEIVPPRSAREPRLIELHRLDADAQRAEQCAELRAGLAAPLPAIAPKYFYDALGSRLFAAITELAEYYPTRTEAAIMAAHLPAIAQAYGKTGCTLIDLGAGNCEKAGRLFRVLQPQAYVALDISAEFLAASLERLQREYQDMRMLGVGIDFSRTLALPDEVPRAQRLYFYPGSSIGNFTPLEAVRFLKQVRATMERDGALLIGVDLVKDKAVLDAAYDDALGVTAAFNLNVLANVNRLAGTDFDVRDWRHVAFYDERRQRIEMHLEARRAIKVSWPGGKRRFDAGERIHTENSYKYMADDFAQLLKEADFATRGRWTDEHAWFAVFLASAA